MFLLIFLLIPKQSSPWAGGCLGCRCSRQTEGLTVQPVCVTRTVRGALAAEFGREGNFKVQDLFAFQAWLSLVIEASQRQVPLWRR